MAVEDLSLLHRAGKTIYLVIWRLSDGLVWDSDDDSFKALGSATSPYLTTTAEASMGGRGFSVYRRSLDLSRVNSSDPADYQLMGYTRSGGSPDLAADPPAGYLSLCIDQGRSKLTGSRVEELIDAVVEGAGTGDCLVDQDYPTEGSLCYTTEGGVPVDNVDVRAYLKSDYCNNRRDNKYVKGYTTTKSNGDWRSPMNLDEETYIFEFRKQGVVGPDTVEITVECL